MGGNFLIDAKPLNGHLDRMRESPATLDETIADAKAMSKKKGKDSNSHSESNRATNNGSAIH
jgi:hypothetical protein